METRIDIEEIIELLKKRVGLIIISIFGGLAIAAIVTFFVLVPKYSSSTQLVATLPVNSESNNININDVNANLMMITTYKDFIEEGSIVSETAKKELKKSISFTGSAKDITNMISIGQKQNSQMFTITAESKNPYEAKEVVNTVSSVFKEKAQGIIGNIDKITIVSKGKVDTQPIFPNHKLVLAIGVFLGMVFGVLFSLLLEFFDKTVKEEAYITEVLRLTNLGIVPEMTTKEKNSRIIKST